MRWSPKRTRAPQEIGAGVEPEDQGMPSVNQVDRRPVFQRIISAIGAPWLRRSFDRQQRQEATRQNTPQSRFESLIGTATEVAQINPRGVFDLIKATLRPLQSERMLAIAERHTVDDPVDSYWFFGEAVRKILYSPDGMDFRGLKLDEKRYELHLARDMILPGPWSRSRYIEAMAHYGSMKEYDKIDRFPDADYTWRQDDNHSVVLWLPWRIGFVCSGNHSITAGILAGEGTIVPDDVYDMSFLLDELYCDGRFFRSAKTKKILSGAPDIRISAAFEMGRLVSDVI
jgi:hypothetical protein